MALVPYATQRITLLTSATPLTAATYNEAVSTNAPYDTIRRPEMATITVEIGEIRCTLDGTTPTTTAAGGTGHLFSIGDVITLKGYQEIAQFQAINAVAASGATIQVTYYHS